MHSPTYTKVILVALWLVIWYSRKPRKPVPSHPRALALLSAPPPAMSRMPMNLLFVLFIVLNATVHCPAKPVPMSQWVDGTASFFGGPPVSNCLECEVDFSKFHGMMNAAANHHQLRFNDLHACSVIVLSVFYLCLTTGNIRSLLHAPASPAGNEKRLL